VIRGVDVGRRNRPRRRFFEGSMARPARLGGHQLGLDFEARSAPAMLAPPLISDAPLSPQSDRDCGPPNPGFPFAGPHEADLHWMQDDVSVAKGVSVAKVVPACLPGRRRVPFSMYDIAKAALLS
jgi:hypothetical protein